MSWSNFVGLPHADLGRERAGVDCYGLLRLVYAEVLGVDLPSYTEAYGSCEQRDELAVLISGETSAHPWRSVEIPQAYDALQFRIGRHDCHLGIAVDRRRMLHVHERSHSVIVPIMASGWRDRLVGIYRHEALS